MRFEPEEGTGGLKPYLHVRRDLWAKLTRALFYELVERGEERMVDGRAMFGVALGQRILCDGRSRCAEGIRLMKAHQEAPDALSGEQFFERARARLTLDVPHGLNDPNIIPIAATTSPIR